MTNAVHAPTSPASRRAATSSSADEQAIDATLKLTRLVGPASITARAIGFASPLPSPKTTMSASGPFKPSPSNFQSFPSH